MKNPTIKQLKKRPAAFWDNVNDSIRITYPNGTTETADSNGKNINFIESWFETKSFAKNSPYRHGFEFIGWL